MKRSIAIAGLVVCSSGLVGCGAAATRSIAPPHVGASVALSRPHLHGMSVPPRWLTNIISRERRVFENRGHGSTSISFGKHVVTIQLFGEFTRRLSRVCMTAPCPAMAQPRGTSLRITADRQTHRVLSVVLGDEIDHTQAVKIAHDSAPYLSIFSAVPGKKACSIPKGGVHRARTRGFSGRCVTEYAASGSLHGRGIRIRFGERWRSGHHVHRAGWIVTVSYRNGRVLSTRVFGEPPQLWR